MPEYFAGVCKNCQEDCDGMFCSIECMEEWNDGKADFDYERRRDAQIEKFLDFEE